MHCLPVCMQLDLRLQTESLFAPNIDSVMSPQDGKTPKTYIVFIELKQREVVTVTLSLAFDLQLNSFVLQVLRQISWFHIKHVQFLLLIFMF